MTDESWRDVDGEARSVTLTLSTTCDHCAQPVPINGPVQAARCPRCTRVTPVPHLYEAIACASTGVAIRGAYDCRWFDDAKPECVRCGKGVPVDDVLRKEGASTTIVCMDCGTEMPTYPAPQWLKKLLPTTLQVLGGTGDGTDELHVNEDASEPSTACTMVCPACGDGISIGPDDGSAIDCLSCHASVFVPDELWKRLHPVKTALRWTLTYTGTLASPTL
jgi:hypothetical protein